MLRSVLCLFTGSEWSWRSMPAWFWPDAEVARRQPPRPSRLRFQPAQRKHRGTVHGNAQRQRRQCSVHVDTQRQPAHRPVAEYECGNHQRHASFGGKLDCAHSNGDGLIEFRAKRFSNAAPDCVRECCGLAAEWRGGHRQALNVVSTTNDPTGVNWSASGAGCSGSACGTFSPTSTLNGVAATWTSPSTPGVYTLNAVSAGDGTTSASTTVGVTDLAGLSTVHYDWRAMEQTRRNTRSPRVCDQRQFWQALLLHG